MSKRNSFLKISGFVILILFLFYSTLLSQNYKQYAQSHQTQLIQALLILNGYNPGPIDGIIGTKTQYSIIQFQNAKKLPLTGQPDKTTIKALIKGIATQLNIYYFESLSDSKFQNTSSNNSKLLLNNYGFGEDTVDYKGRIVPKVAENESRYGEISPNTGRPKEVYVRGHFRSRPRR